MNATRRRRLQTIMRQADILLEQLRELQEAEEEARDNMPESLQESERYEKMDQAAEILGDAADTFGEIIDNLEGIL